MMRSLLNGFMILVVTAAILLISNVSCQGSFDATKSDIASNTIVLGDTSSSKESNTSVVVNKTIDGTKGYPDLIYKISVPKVDYFDFVLALDSSGSFSYGQEHSEARAVAGAVPQFIEDITKVKEYKNKSINLSIISFDDNIDFAYTGSNENDPFKNNDIRLAKLINATDVDRDIKNHDDVFGANTDNFDYYANETEFTNLSIPIEASIDILDSVEQDRLHRISKFMILVTGKSEISNCTAELLQLAKEKNYPIFVIAIDLSVDNIDAPKMKSQLMKISEFDEHGWYRLQYVPLGATPDELKKNLFIALKNSLANAINSPAARDVTIIESFYPYIRPKLDSIDVNGKIGLIKNLNYSNIDNVMSFELDQELFPESETTVTIPLELHLSGLPVSITANSVPFSIGLINESTPISTIKYLWFDGYQGNLPLTENELSLDINSQNSGGVLNETEPFATDMDVGPSPSLFDSLKRLLGD